MRGGVTLFRGAAKGARRYVDAGQGRAVKSCWGHGDCRIEYLELDGTGNVTARRFLTVDMYLRWADWLNPITGERMGTPRRPAKGKAGSPRFADMTMNGQRDWSITAARDRDFAAALNAAYRDAAEQICGWVARHAVTRMVSRGEEEHRPVEGLQIVLIEHDRDARSNLYKHVHIQMGARVLVDGKWRAFNFHQLLFEQQATIRALGDAIIDSHLLQPRPASPEHGWRGPRFSALP